MTNKIKVEVTTMNTLRKQVETIYKKVPKFDSFDCKKQCESGKCKFECCTCSGCTNVEAVLINAHIKNNKLDLPLITSKGSIGYMLPNSNGVTNAKRLFEGEEGFKDVTTSRCLYLGRTGCKIYNQRPMICRLFGLTKLMPCEYIKNQTLLSEEETMLDYFKELVEMIPDNANVKVI